MSIAHGFDPDVSPIYPEDDSLHSVHFSSADTPKRAGRLLQISSIAAISANSSNDNETLALEIPSTHLSTTDRSNGTVERSITLEIVGDSTENNAPILFGTYIVISAGCCLPIRRHLSSNLINLGAVIQDNVDEATTHLVVDRYADVKIVRNAMKRTMPPLMVDIQWIQQCIDRGEHVDETDFSMMDCNYLKEKCRQLQTIDVESNSFDIDFENISISDSPVHLIDQIRMLSDRLDALINNENLIRYAYHSPDCPTRQRAKKPSNLDIEKIRNCLETMSDAIEIKRRRSFSGFVYEHRSEDKDILQLISANKDCRNVWVAVEARKKNKPAKKITMVNDMRKTIPSDLNTMRNVYKDNSMIRKKRENGKNKKVKAKQKRTQIPTAPLEPIRIEDSDIESAMASLTILSPSQPPVKKNARNCFAKPTEPLVPTKSNFINKLQVPDSFDDFISDVSAFRNVRNGGVVFTGFHRQSDIEKKLKKYARKYNLVVQDEINEYTRFVVSRYGHRTLIVIKAVCMAIPIIKPQWLEESFEDSKLLKIDKYLYDEWKDVVKYRKENGIIFDNNVKVFVHQDCIPSKNDLSWIIEKCGGKVTKKMEKASLIVAPQGIEIPVDVPVVLPLFFIDSVSQNVCLDVEDYFNYC